MTINHLHVFGTEFAGPVCKSLFDAARTFGITLLDTASDRFLLMAAATGEQADT